ncbi:TlpA disulfide reductase family protein [Abyssalbus ytuae]|uniref:AhpC/TSA family protein n=1 Tax=Abyssalbus ytuae TaxID=2926907 RepID=A0A9E7A1D2_9FLAO|nr:TlpA disulfide reductase family protein [Abyssalbus ytuae]UOB17946.1 AhpC/TSA family protein [Abyssalbus ytuae]
MIKKNILFVLTFLTLWGCNENKKDENYSLTVKINDLNNPNAKVYIVNSLMKLNAQTIIDSASLKNRMFFIKGKISEPKQVFLLIDKKGNGLNNIKGISGFLGMYLEEGDIVVNIKDSINNAVITGSNLNTEYKKFINETRIPSKLNEESILLNKAIKEETSPEKKTKLESERVNLVNKRVKYKDSLLLTYIQKNPNSYFSLDALTQLDRKNLNESTLTLFFENLSEKLRTSKKGMEVLENITKKRAEKGVLAPDFSQSDENGSLVKLSDYRGKYVLLDFWASWCRPCRAENPNLVKAYEKYNAKGFEILAVSLDTKKEAWLKAIKQENLPWAHVSDLKGFKNEVAILYDVQSIPKNLLIDPKGKIVTTNLRGYRLEEELSQIFK